MEGIVPAAVFFGGLHPIRDEERRMAGIQKALAQPQRRVGAGLKVVVEGGHRPAGIGDVHHAGDALFHRDGAAAGPLEPQFPQKGLEAGVLYAGPHSRQHPHGQVVAVRDHCMERRPDGDGLFAVIRSQGRVGQLACIQVVQFAVQIKQPLLRQIAEPERIGGFQQAGGVILGRRPIAVFLPGGQVQDVHRKAAALGCAKGVQRLDVQPGGHRRRRRGRRGDGS